MINSPGPNLVEKSAHSTVKETWRVNESILDLHIAIMGRAVPHLNVTIRIKWSYLTVMQQQAKNLKQSSCLIVFSKFLVLPRSQKSVRNSRIRGSIHTRKEHELDLFLLLIISALCRSKYILGYYRIFYRACIKNQIQTRSPLFQFLKSMFIVPFFTLK